MTRRAEVLFVAMAGLAAAMLCPALASAATQCQAAATTAVGPASEDTAIAAWTAQVKQTYGAAWSNYALAKNPTVTEENLALANVFIVTGYACRVVIPTPVAKPNLAIGRHLTP